MFRWLWELLGVVKKKPRRIFLQPRDLRFLPPIPEGMRRCASDVEIAGINYRLETVGCFIRGQNHGLKLEWEPDNPHDPNAIMVWGVSSNEWNHIGYLPRDLAAFIHGNQLWGKISPRLRNIWVGRTGYIVIRLDILEPKPPRKKKSG